MKPTKTTLANTFVFAWKGIILCLNERNFCIELAVAVAAVLLGVLLQVSFLEWLIIILCIGVVLGAEAMNTAIEAIVDLASPEYHNLAALAKDCAAGGVLICSIASFIIGCLIFIPKLCVLLGWL